MHYSTPETTMVKQIGYGIDSNAADHFLHLEIETIPELERLPENGAQVVSKKESLQYSVDTEDDLFLNDYEIDFEAAANDCFCPYIEIEREPVKGARVASKKESLQEYLVSTEDDYFLDEDNSIEADYIAHNNGKKTPSNVVKRLELNGHVFYFCNAGSQTSETLRGKNNLLVPDDHDALERASIDSNNVGIGCMDAAFIGAFVSESALCGIAAISAILL